MQISELQRILQAPLDGTEALDGWTVECEGYYPYTGERLYFTIKDFGINYENGSITLFLVYDDDN